MVDPLRRRLTTGSVSGAIDPVLTGLDDPRAAGASGIARDAEAALAALADAGFEQGEHELIRSSHEWDAEGIRGLFATFSPIARLEPARRDEILDEIARIAETTSATVS